MLEDMALLLQFSDYTIINAHSTKIAEGLLKVNLPDIIISDFCNREINSFLLLDKIRKDLNTRYLPFIIMVADNNKIEVPNRFNYQITKVLKKPLQGEVLLDQIISLVEVKKTENKSPKGNPVNLDSKGLGGNPGLKVRSILNTNKNLEW